MTIAVVAGILLATVPVSQTAEEQFSIYDPGSASLYFGVNQTFPASGTFDFTWQASSISGVTLTILDPNGRPVYNDVNQSGSASLSVAGGGAYLFEVSTPATETVTVDGALHYVAPMI